MSFKYIAKGSIGFTNILETILKNKGIADINSFLNPTESSLESEFLFDNIEIAANCLITHINKKNNIAIVVDTDVDGNTSAAMMYQYIQRICPEIYIDFIIHNGKEHGLDNETMFILEHWIYDLIIVPDAGSNNYKELELLSNLGIDVIVLDHHMADRYSEYGIIVNNQLSSKITDKAMTGVGVVYKFCKVLDSFYEVDYSDDYLDLVALGMIADSCDLRNTQSRYLVNKGIDVISKKENKNNFITELINSQMYSMKNKVSIIGIAFYVAPLINSLIRIGTQDDKISMFKAFCNLDELVHTKIRGQGEVDISIHEYSRRLCETSRRKQKKLVEENVNVLNEQIKECNLDKFAILVCNAGDNVDKNFTGLIANKLASKYQRPCLLLRKDKDSCSGSGRGFGKCEIKDFKSWCENTKLFHYSEGHAQAFGTSLSINNINNLYSLISSIEQSKELIYDVDAIFSDKTLNKSIIEQISKYNYVWGTTVDEPVFAIENIVVNKSEVALIGKTQNTIKFLYNNIEFVKFNTNIDTYSDIISLGEAIKFTVIGRFGINEYGSTKTAQVMIDDFMFEASKEVKKFRF